MNKKNRIIIIVSIVVLAVIALLTNNNTQTTSKRSARFSFVKSAKIDKIVISTPTDEFSFESINNSWIVDDEIEVNQQLIEAMFLSLEKLKMLYPVSNAESSSIKNRIVNNGNELKLYHKDKLLYKLQYITHKNNNIALNKKGVPYYVNVQGYRLMPLDKVIPPMVEHWMDRLLINLEPNEIKELSIKYSKPEKAGFILLQNNDEYMLKNLDEELANNINQESLQDYLQFFKGITYQIADTSTYVPHIQSPLFTFHLLTTKERTINMIGVKLINKQNGSENISQFAALINRKNLVYLNYSDFDPILAEYNFFVAKENSSSK